MLLNVSTGRLSKAMQSQLDNVVVPLFIFFLLSVCFLFILDTFCGIYGGLNISNGNDVITILRYGAFDLTSKVKILKIEITADLVIIIII